MCIVSSIYRHLPLFIGDPRHKVIVDQVPIDIVPPELSQTMPLLPPSKLPLLYSRIRPLLSTTIVPAPTTLICPATLEVPTVKCPLIVALREYRSPTFIIAAVISFTQAVFAVRL